MSAVASASVEGSPRFMVEVIEGLEVAAMLRAAELILAVDATLGPVGAEFGWPVRSPPVWLRLLAAPARRRLLACVGRGHGRAHDSGPESAERLLAVQRGEVLGQPRRDILMATGPAAPHYPRPGTSLVVLANFAGLRPEVRERYDDVAVVDPEGELPPGVAILADAVDPQLFGAAPARLGDSPLLVISHGEPVRDLALLRDLQEAGVPRLVLFDPTGATPRDVDLGRAVRVVGRLDSEERATEFRRCRAVVAARRDRFVAEAMACGCRHLGAADEPRGVARRLALPPSSASDGSPSAPDLGWFATGRAVSPPSSCLTVGPHRAGLYTRLIDVPAPDHRPRTVLISASGEVALDAELAALLRGAQQIVLHTPDSPDLLVAIKGLGTEPPTRFEPELAPVLAQILAAETATDVVIVFRRADRRAWEALKIQLEALARRRRRRATLLIGGPQFPPESGPPNGQIGISVAMDTVARGLSIAASPTWELLWMAGQSGPRARTFLYPYDERVGVDGEQIDPPGLPQLFASGKVDLVARALPEVHDLLQMRLAYATRSVPIVNALHSVHAAEFAMFMLQAQLVGPTFEFDSVVSPSRAGAAACRALLARLAEWSGRRFGAPVQHRARIDVIPYGVETAGFAGLDRAACRLALGIHPELSILTSLGRFDRNEKADLLPLLVALRSLVSNHPNLRLILAGSQGPFAYAQRIAAMANELGIGAYLITRVNIDARVKNLLLGATDIFVAPTDNIQETFGLSLVEASAAGLPIVASDWSGYRDIVVDGETGFLVPTYWTTISYTDELAHLSQRRYTLGDLNETVAIDVPQLTDRLRCLLADRQLARAMGERGRVRAQKEFDQVVVAERRLELFAELIDRATATSWARLKGDQQPLIPGLSAQFGGYATRFVGPSWRVLPGLEVDEALVRAIDVGAGREEDRLRAVAEAAGGTLEAVCKKLAAAWRCDDEEVTKRVLRAAKYGLVVLLPPV